MAGLRRQFLDAAEFDKPAGGKHNPLKAIWLISHGQSLRRGCGLAILCGGVRILQEDHKFGRERRDPAQTADYIVPEGPAFHAPPHGVSDLSGISRAFHSQKCLKHAV
jgi:hypothetical protein